MKEATIFDAERQQHTGGSPYKVEGAAYPKSKSLEYRLRCSDGSEVVYWTRSVTDALSLFSADPKHRGKGIDAMALSSPWRPGQ